MKTLACATILVASIPLAGHAQTRPATPAAGPAAVEGVVITAAPKAKDEQLDRTVYSVARDLQATSGAAADVLNNVTSVSVDADGNLSLRESSLFLGWSGQDWFIRRPGDRQWERYTATDEAGPHTLELRRSARLPAPDQDLALKRDDEILTFETDTSDWLALSSLQDGLVRVTTRGTGLSGQLTLCTEKDAHVMVVR